MVDNQTVQGDFLRVVPTLESGSIETSGETGVTVNLSFSDTFAVEVVINSFLLRIGSDGADFACAYLTEAQLATLIEELQNAKAAFEGRASGVNARGL